MPLGEDMARESSKIKKQRVDSKKNSVQTMNQLWAKYIDRLSLSRVLQRERWESDELTAAGGSRKQLRSTV